MEPAESSDSHSSDSLINRHRSPTESIYLTQREYFPLNSDSTFSEESSFYRAPMSEVTWYHYLDSSLGPTSPRLNSSESASTGSLGPPVSTYFAFLLGLLPEREEQQRTSTPIPFEVESLNSSNNSATTCGSSSTSTSINTTPEERQPKRRCIQDNWQC